MRPLCVLVAVAVASLALLGGCRRGAPEDTSSAPVPSASARPSAAPAQVDAGGMTGAAAALATRAETKLRLRARSAAKAGEMVDVAGRVFPSGSTPGDDGRDPTLEPINVSVMLSSFSIDALPYPNDPALPPKTGVARGEAARLCAERGARLCTELEWELACKGPELDPFASGEGWDAACERDPTTCVSGYGARAMGALREWTSSDVAISAEGASAQAAVRGAGTQPSGDGGPPSPGGHRCSHRARANDGRGAVDLGFRCCKGVQNGALIAPVEHYPAFRRTKVDADQLARIFATIPELASLKDVRLFDRGDIKEMLERASDGVELTTQPILWSPEAGEEVLVATGRTKSMSFVVALYPLADDKYRLASYFLMLGDVAPVALAFERHRREQILWSTCWGCAGEQGSVRARDDHRIVIVQH